MAASGDGFAVATNELRAHADHVAGVAATVRQGHDAAETVRLGTEAYGRLCQFVPGLIDPMQREAAELLADVSSALVETGERLHHAAEAYVAADERAAESAHRTGSPRR
jgi:hypothetical protein